MARRKRRNVRALLFGIGTHLMIGLMFGPFVWFALLMMTLLVRGWAPTEWFEPFESLATRLERRVGRDDGATPEEG